MTSAVAGHVHAAHLDSLGAGVRIVLCKGATVAEWRSGQIVFSVSGWDARSFFDWPLNAALKYGADYSA